MSSTFISLAIERLEELDQAGGPGLVPGHQMQILGAGVLHGQSRAGVLAGGGCFRRIWATGEGEVDGDMQPEAELAWLSMVAVRTGARPGASSARGELTEGRGGSRALIRTSIVSSSKWVRFDCWQPAS